MTDEAQNIVMQYIDWSYCDDIEAAPLSDWLATDIVRMVELMDAELQQRSERTAEEFFEEFDSDNEGHDPDLDDDGYCRICGLYESE